MYSEVIAKLLAGALVTEGRTVAGRPTSKVTLLAVSRKPQCLLGILELSCVPQLI